MKLDETNPVLRRVGPLKAVDVDGTPVLGADFTGNVETMIPGFPFVGAAGTVVEIGDGYYYYQGDVTDAQLRPWIAVRISGLCEEFVFREDVTVVHDGAIAAGETSSGLRIIGPLRAIDTDGNALSSVVGIDVDISINGTAWAVAGGTLSLGDDGYCYYAPIALEVANPGWIALRLTGACQEFVSREDLAELGGLGGSFNAPTLHVVSTVPVTFGAARLSPWQAEVDDFPNGAQMVIHAHFVERNEMYVARDADGVWRWPFDIEPDNAVDFDADPITVQLLPRGGWPPSEIEIQVSAALEATEI